MYLQGVDLFRYSVGDLWNADADDGLLCAGASWRAFEILFRFSCNINAQERESGQPLLSKCHDASLTLKTATEREVWACRLCIRWATSECSTTVESPDTGWYGCSCVLEGCCFGVGRQWSEVICVERLQGSVCVYMHLISARLKDAFKVGQSIENTNRPRFFSTMESINTVIIVARVCRGFHHVIHSA